jgi:ammonia channel protein AmtB
MTLLSFFLLYRGLKATSTPAFLRSVYGSFMVKFFIVLVAVFGYAFMNKGNLNKHSLFTLMFLYLVYTFLEIKTLMKLSRKVNSNG